MDEATFSMMRPGDEAFAIRFTVALALELEQWDSMTEEGIPAQTSEGEGADLPSTGAGSPGAPGTVARRRFCSDIANAVQPPLHPSRVRVHSVVAGSVVVSYDILPGVGVVPASAAVQLLASLSEPGSRLRAPDTLTSLITAPDASHVHFAPLRVALCADGTSWDLQCIGIMPPSPPPDGPGGGNNGRGGNLAVDGVSSGLGLAILLVCALLLLVGVGIAACVWYSRRRSSSRVHVHNANGTKEAVHVHAVQGRYLPEFARNQSSPQQQQQHKDVVHLKVLHPRLLHVAEASAAAVSLQQPQLAPKAGGWTFDDSSPKHHHHHHRAGSANLPAVQVALDITDEPPATAAGATTAGTDDADAHAHFVVHSPPLSPNGALQELLGSLQPPLGFTSPRLLRDSISLAPSSPSSSQLLHQQHQQQQQQQGNETFVAVKDAASEADGLSALGREVSEPGDLSSSSRQQQQPQQQQPHQASHFADGTAASAVARQGSLSSSSDGGVGGHVGGTAVKVDLPTRELSRAIRLHNEQLHAQHRAQFDLLRQFQPETKTTTLQQQRR
jgi:hypothetical protein